MQALGRKWIVPGLLIVLLAGCGGESTPAPTTAQIGTAVKERFDSFVETALKNPKQAATEMTILMESLDAYARDYGGAFVELRDMTKAAIPEVQKAKNKLELEGILGKLQAKANEIATSPAK